MMRGSDESGTRDTVHAERMGKGGGGRVNEERLRKKTERKKGEGGGRRGGGGGGKRRRGRGTLNLLLNVQIRNDSLRNVNGVLIILRVVVSDP